MDAFTTKFLKNIAERMELDDETTEVFTEVIQESWDSKVASKGASKASSKRKSGGRTKYHVFLAQRKAEGKSYSDNLAEWKTLSEDEKNEFKPEASSDDEGESSDAPKKRKSSVKVNLWQEYLKEYRSLCKDENKKFRMEEAKEGYTDEWKADFKAKTEDQPEETKEAVDDGETTEEEEEKPK